MGMGWQQFESPFLPGECAERLENAIDPSNLLDWPAAGGAKAVYGFVENGWFDLRQRGPKRSHALTALQGELLPSAAGTIVRFRSTWEQGPKWGLWLSVLATIAFGVGTMGLIVYAYFDSPPGPRPYAWAIALFPAIFTPATIYYAWRAAQIAAVQRAFLVEFLQRTLKARPAAKSPTKEQAA